MTMLDVRSSFLEVDRQAWLDSPHLSCQSRDRPLGESWEGLCRSVAAIPRPCSRRWGHRLKASALVIGTLAPNRPFIVEGVVLVGASRAW